MIDEFPDDLATELALQKLDFAISSLLRIDKIIREIQKKESGRCYRQKGSWIGIICKVLLILLLTQLALSVPAFEAELDKSCIGMC
ncbi:unnamed protein product [Allacma fusca]|uniref:Uncharacterized protein n=1 Tax=Allacma fusca TaxID=39272 RepID=A0A8J2NZG8_9HEXA|nr:unnamed protein product [Allacma fusca]